MRSMFGLGVKDSDFCSNNSSEKRLPGRSDPPDRPHITPRWCEGSRPARWFAAAVARRRRTPCLPAGTQQRLRRRTMQVKFKFPIRFQGFASRNVKAIYDSVLWWYKLHCVVNVAKVLKRNVAKNAPAFLYFFFKKTVFLVNRHQGFKR